MNYESKDTHSKFPFKKITKFEGVIDYNIIRKIYNKIQANLSTIQSKTRKGAEWSYRDGNVAIQIPNSRPARILTPSLSSTIISIVKQFSCRQIPKVDTTICSPSGPVVPNVERRIHPQSETPGVTIWKILQGPVPSVHYLYQPHTVRYHPAHVWWSWYNLTHGHWRKWGEMKQ